MSSALDRLAMRGVSAPGERGIDIPLAKIRFDPTQPRKAYRHLDGQVAEKDEAYIAELAKTIEENGLIQAITVQEQGDGSYLVVVGECRTRAHLLLGKPTIRAVVRNDLTNASRRLLYQIVENVTRQKLTDQELAESIQKLKEGGDGVEPLSQVQIAKILGKSEGWVSRFVKYGDEELQRLWVKSGIADSVEHVYRLSILPSAMQVDIRRRVELPEDDVEWLAKPLGRDTIDKFTKQAKIEKAGKKKDVKPVHSVAPKQDSTLTSTAVDSGASGGVSEVDDAGSGFGPITGPDGDRGWLGNTLNGVSKVGETITDTEDVAGCSETDGTSDSFLQSVQPDAQLQAQALATAVMDAHSVTEPKGAASLASAKGGYSLPEEARAAILGSTGVASSSSGGQGASAQPKQAPVNCRVPMGSVVALLDVLKANEAMNGALDAVQCELTIPGPLAQLIANELSGMIVDHKDVPSLMQRQLVRLGQAPTLKH